MIPELKSLTRRFVARSLSLATALPLLFAATTLAQAPSSLVTVAPGALATAVDSGAVPGSQRLSLTITLAQDPSRSAALDQFLADVTSSSSPSYHKWLTPAQFAAAYGPSTEALATATAWAQANALSVDSVSPSGSRLTVSGSAARIQTAFAISLRQYQIAGHLFFANSTQPSSVPFAAAIDGLDDLPASRSAQSTGQTQDSFAALAGLVDANASSVLILDSSLTADTVTPSHLAEYNVLARQAAAQGITLLASSAFPALRPEILAIAKPGDAPVAALDPSIAAQRPAWQTAPGLPAGQSRVAPDFAAADLNAFAQAIASLDTQIGTRQGNVAGVLYSLGPIPHLFNQPDSAAAGTWEEATGLGLIDLKVLAQAFPRATGGAQLQLQANPSSIVHGTTFTLAAQVSSTNGGPTPTGTVTFTSANQAFPQNQVVFLGSGSGSFTPTPLPGGTYNVTATYSGDGTYGSATGSTTVTIQPEAANFIITAPATATLGGSIPVSVQLGSVSGVGVPSGSVTVTPNGLNGAAPQTATLSTLNGYAVASFTFSAKQAASITFQAACTTADQSFTCYNQPSTGTNIPQSASTTTLTSSSNNPVAGTAISLTATVAGVAGVSPTGTIQFLDGSTNIGSGSAPTATVSGILLSGSATHSITAVYQGDTNYTTSTSNIFNPAVAKDPTTTTGTLTSPSFTYGGTDSLVVTVVPATGSNLNSGGPTGSVTITGLVSGLAPALGGGTVTVTLDPLLLQVGTYPIAISYPGDSNYAASQSGTINLTVTPAMANLQAPMLSSTSFTQGSTATLTLNIKLPGNGVLPANSGFTANIINSTGVVVSTQPGVFTVNAGGNTGTGQLTINAPAAGTYTFQVACSTNLDFTCNTPTPITITSTATTTAPVSTGTTATSTVLTTSPATPAAGAPITLTATVSAAAAATTANPIGGTVIFYDGTTAISTAVAIATVGANGVATTSVTLAGATTHSLTAVYSGNTVYATSTSAAVAVVTAAVPAAITLTSSTTNGLAGLAVTLTARVTGSTTTGVSPTGSVSFYLANTVTLLGTVNLTGAGAGNSIATFTTTGIPAGSQTIYAVYSGDPNFGTITSASITLGLSDFSATFTPQTLTLKQGSSGQVVVQLSSISGFVGTVAFGCIPPPNTQITCSFNNTLVGPGGSSTMTIFTALPQTASLHLPQTNLEARLAGVTSLAALLCILLPGRKRRRISALLLVLLTLVLSTNLGCSAQNFNSTNPVPTLNSGTPFGTFIVTVNTAGSDGTNTIRHNYSYQVTVQ